MNEAHTHRVVISRKDAKSIGIKRCFTGKACKSGHICDRSVSNGNCVECSRLKQLHANKTKEQLESSREKHKEYYIKNKASIRSKHNDRLRNDIDYRKTKNEKNKEYRIRNIERIREYDRKRLQDNKEEKYLYFSIRRKENRDAINKYMRDYKSKKRKESNWGKADVYRSLIRGAITRAGNKKNNKTIDIVGYDYKKFIERITYTFKKGMTWNNYGEWHIDHIIPISHFTKKGVNSPMVINSLCNLRAMWAIDNIKKGSKHPFRGSDGV